MNDKPIVKYALITLKNDQTQEVVKELRDRGREKLANWFEELCKGGMYGNKPEEWKPFQDKTITELLECKEVRYHPATELLGLNADDPIPDMVALKQEKIDIYFIDLFAALLPNYSKLAESMDAFLAGADSRCCFIAFPGAESELLALIQDEYQNAWRNISGLYQSGEPHHLAVRVDDLLNIRERLAQKAVKRANPNTRDLVAASYGDRQGPFS